MQKHKFSKLGPKIFDLVVLDGNFEKLNSCLKSAVIAKFRSKIKIFKFATKNT